MELYIQIRDGKPFEHPILGDNLRQAFPEIDANNLPAEFARFGRVEKPSIGPYEIYEGATYELIDGVCKDVHQVRQMTPEEKSARVAEITAGVLADIENLKTWAAEQKAQDTPDMQDVWQKYIDDLNAVDTQGDPVLIVLPAPPTKDLSV